MATTTVEVQQSEQILATPGPIKIIDTVRNNFMTYLFLGLTCKSFFANLIFMVVRFSGLNSNEAGSWLLYISIFLFLFAFTLPIVLTFEEKLRNQFPQNLLSILAFTSIVSISASLFNLNSLDENVWAVCYLSLFSFLFIFVIGSAGFVDLSNSVHLYLLSCSVLLALSGIFLVFSYIMNIDVHFFILMLDFAILASFIDKNKIDPTVLTIQELTKTMACIYASFVFRILKTIYPNMRDPI